MRKRENHTVWCTYTFVSITFAPFSSAHAVELDMGSAGEEAIDGFSK